jgi:hypothetical protein
MKLRRVLAITAVMMAASAGDALAASLRIQAPSKISSKKYFHIFVSGTGRESQNTIYLFFTLHSKCAKKYIGETHQNHHVYMGTMFVSQHFDVEFNGVYGPDIYGGGPGRGLFCGYLFPSSQTTNLSGNWVYKKPSAMTTRKVKFTRGSACTVANYKGVVCGARSRIM